MPQSEEERKREHHESTESSVSEDEKVDEASKESFPASDPPSYTRTPRQEKEEEGVEGGKRGPKGGERGPRHSSTDPSEREETV